MIADVDFTGAVSTTGSGNHVTIQGGAVNIGNTITATSRNIAIISSGAVLDSGNNTTSKIEAAGVTITANGGAIGESGDAIEITATTLDLSATGGDIVVTEADGVTLTDIDTTTSGNIDITVTTGDVVVTDVNAANGAGNVSLTVAGAITTGADDDTADIKAGTLTIDASGQNKDIGESASDYLEVDATTFDIETTNSTDSGSIFVENLGTAATTVTKLDVADGGTADGEINVKFAGDAAVTSIC